MHKPNLEDSTRGELLIICAAALDKLQCIEQAVSEAPKPTVLVMKARSHGKTTDLITDMARDNHLLRLKLEKVQTLLGGSTLKQKTTIPPHTTPPFPFPKFNGLTVMLNDMLPPMTMMVGQDVYTMLTDGVPKENPNA